MRKYVLGAALISALSTSALAGASTGGLQLSIAKSFLYTNQVADQKFTDKKVTPTEDLSFEDANHEIRLGYMFKLHDNMSVGLRLSTINPANYASENLITSEYKVTSAKATNLYNFDTFTLANGLKFDQALVNKIKRNIEKKAFSESDLISESDLKLAGLDGIIKSTAFEIDGIKFITATDSSSVKVETNQLTKSLTLLKAFEQNLIVQDLTSGVSPDARTLFKIGDISDAKLKTSGVLLLDGAKSKLIEDFLVLTTTEKITGATGGAKGDRGKKGDLAKEIAKALEAIKLDDSTAKSLNLEAFSGSDNEHINFINAGSATDTALGGEEDEGFTVGQALKLKTTVQKIEEYIAAVASVAFTLNGGAPSADTELSSIKGFAELNALTTANAILDIEQALTKKDFTKLKKITENADQLSALQALTGVNAIAKSSAVELNNLSKIIDKNSTTLDSVNNAIQFNAKVSDIKKKILEITTAKRELTELNFKDGVTIQGVKTIFLEVPFSFSKDLADNLTGGFNFIPGFGSLTIVQTTTQKQSSGKMATLTSEQKGETFSLSGEAFLAYRPTDSYSIRFTIGGSGFGAVETTNTLSFTKGGTDVTEMTSGLFKLNERKVDDANKPFFSMYNLKVGVGFNMSL